jgi:dipeptidyl aminopeptidase/acylaminoacyl peptidase
MNFKIVIAFIGIVLGAGIFYFLNNQTYPNPIKNISQQAKSGLQSDDEPFQEMTIPYLRSRTYESTLGDLDQTSQNSNYTSYLTNYDSDDLNINGLLTIPTGSEPEGGWPAIIFIHGYIPPTQYSTLTRYTDHVDYLARNGFVVFKIDLRGHGNSEGEPGGAYYSGDYIIDVLNARAALQSSDFVNPESIGLWGHSMAGNVVFRAIAVESEIPAVSIWAGAVYTYEDWQQYRLNDNSYRPPGMTTQRNAKRKQLFDTHGEFDPDSDFWSKVPATNYLPYIKGAVQLNHSVDDSVVSVEYSRNLNEILDSTSIVHEFNEYNSGGHNISGAAFNQAMQATVEFFKRHL